MGHPAHENIRKMDPTHTTPNIQTKHVDPQIMNKLKSAAMEQATNQSLGNFKLNDNDSNYGNFLIPTLPTPK